jgi:uncharacterized protein YidB (DUF937 family)
LKCVLPFPRNGGRFFFAASKSISSKIRSTLRNIEKFTSLSDISLKTGLLLGFEVNTMGIMDMIQSLAGQTGAAAGTDQAKVAGGFIEALTQHPEGIQGVLDAFKNNGMAEHVNSWGAGQAATATPEQVQQGLSGTGLIEKTAAKAGVSPQVVQMALATVLPMVVQHFAPNGQATPASGMAGMAQQLLSKLA